MYIVNAAINFNWCGRTLHLPTHGMGAVAALRGPLHVTSEKCRGTRKQLRGRQRGVAKRVSTVLDDEYCRTFEQHYQRTQD